MIEEYVKDLKSVLSNAETLYLSLDCMDLEDIKEILEAVEIPVHTIGYNANIKALENISAINEATSINADSDDVIYKLGSLFNAEM